MLRLKGILIDEAQNPLPEASESCIAYIEAHRRLHSTPWLPIQVQEPAKGIQIAAHALDIGLPFLILEPDESPEDFDLAIESAYEKHTHIGLFSRSSGSSGRVKLIPRTLESWVLSFEAHCRAFDLHESKTWLICGNTGFSATIYHALLGLYLGKTVYVQGSLSTATTISLIQNHQIDTLLTVPTRLGILLKAAARNACEAQLSVERISLFSTLTCDPLIGLERVVTVGEVLSPRVRTLALEMLINTALYHYYGAAELGQVAYCSYQELAQMPRLLGHAFYQVSYAVDLDGNIQVNSPYLALDYPAPATVFDKGEIRDGLLFFKGRVDLQFNRHGKKHNLEALSQRLAEHPKLSAYWIERIPDPHQDMALEAYNLHLLIELTTGSSQCERYERPTDPQELEPIIQQVHNWCKEDFSPKSILIYHQAGHTSGGKLSWHRMQPDRIIKR